LPGVTVNGLDAIKVYQTIREAAARARAGEGPTLVEAKVFRMTPHSSDDDDRSYRDREELEDMKARDPLKAFRRVLMERGVLTDKIDEEFEARAKAQVEDANQFAEEAPYPKVAEAGYPVYVEEINRG
jgi:2-oxoisovalerate dehydrogenase E1 component alpha subunit